MGRMIKIREETYKKIETYAAARGTTKAGAVTILVEEALNGGLNRGSGGLEEITERLEGIEKKLNKLILLEMEK